MFQGSSNDKIISSNKNIWHNAWYIINIGSIASIGYKMKGD